MFSLRPRWLATSFYIALAVAILVYLLRGFAVLSMIPGFVIGILWTAAFGLGIYLALSNLR
jgi:predicted membrane channel-forming protein YqfA (hemolysin III family)